MLVAWINRTRPELNIIEFRWWFQFLCVLPRSVKVPQPGWFESRDMKGWSLHGAPLADSW